MDKSVAQLPPKSVLGEAIGYGLGHGINRFAISRGQLQEERAFSKPTAQC
ncbi:MAG: hypothetical protein H6964_11340 [Chromatiaceae bacterium]|nr:hypothetical protein [Chromatiaceae bacterium]MCP5447570.1 hypothetical protein [Chromatiaceae bacterium]